MPYQINSPTVSSENIDGEVIIVNLESGSYYSTVEMGAYLWDRIIAGHSADAIGTDLAALYADHADDVTPTVADFIARLKDEKLITICDSNPAQGQQPTVDAVPPRQFAAPVLECFSDMKDMLLLDPVHDVADVGWPTTKPEQ